MTVETAVRGLRLGQIRDAARRIAAIRTVQGKIIDAVADLIRWRDGELWDDLINQLLTALQSANDGLHLEVGSLLQDSDDDIAF